MDITPIPTIYNNTKFRSKLEASYAKTLDSLGIKWEYEVNGYQIDDIKYLPDFWLPEINTYLEVKGPHVPGAEKAEKLSKIIDKNNHDWWNPDTLVLIGNERGFIRMAINNTVCLLAQCSTCQKYWFMPSELSYACRNCREYDGDHHLLHTSEKLKLKQIEILTKRFS